MADPGAGIVIDANGFYTLAELLLAHGSIALGLDLSLALAVGGLGLLEDVDDVLALGVVSTCLSRGVLSGTYAAHHLARLVNNGDCFADSHGGGWSLSLSMQCARRSSVTCGCGGDSWYLFVRVK